MKRWISLLIAIAICMTMGVTAAADMGFESIVVTEHNKITGVISSGTIPGIGEDLGSPAVTEFDKILLDPSVSGSILNNQMPTDDGSGLTQIQNPADQVNKQTEMVIYQQILTAEPIEKQVTYALGEFVDIKEDDWFFDAVCWVYQEGYMRGVSKSVFAPNEAITQAMTVTVLARLIDAELETQDTKEWYDAAAQWAADAKLIDMDSFEPNEPISRGDLAVMLVSLFKYEGIRYERPNNSNRQEFADKERMTEEQESAFHILCKAMIFQGNGEGFMGVEDNTTRAQFATLLQRICNYMENK